MDWQFAFNLAFGVASFAMGTLSKVMWDTISTLRSDLAKLATAVNADRSASAETYARRDDFTSAINRLETTIQHRFDRLEQRLDGKADKS